MKSLVFSVFDNAVKAFLPPFYAPTKGAAIRMFSDACQAEGSQFGKHAGDYALFALGEFDDNSGSLSALPVPERILTALEVGSPGGMPAAAFNQ